MDDVVCILVLDGVNDVVMEFQCHRELGRAVPALEKLLDDAAPVRLERECDDIVLDDGGDPLDLLWGPNVEELLDDVVAKDVGHQRGPAVADLTEETLPGDGADRGRVFEPLLDEAGPELVLGVCLEVLDHVFQGLILQIALGKLYDGTIAIINSIGIIINTNGAIARRSLYGDWLRDGVGVNGRRGREYRGCVPACHGGCARRRRAGGRPTRRGVGRYQDVDVAADVAGGDGTKYASADNVGNVTPTLPVAVVTANDADAATIDDIRGVNAGGIGRHPWCGASGDNDRRCHRRSRRQ